MKKLSLTLLALFASLPAHSGTQTINVTFSDLQFKVYDFNQWDDMDPSFSIDFAAGHWNQWANRMQIGDGDRLVTDTNYHVKPASLGYSNGDKHANISVTANGMQFDVRHNSNADVSAFVTQFMHYTLGPGSMLEVTGKLHMYASDPNSYVTTTAAFTNTMDLGYGRLDREWHGPISYNESFTIQAINTNWEPSYGELQIWMWGNAAATGIPPAIPEPGTWAMLSAGLLGLGVMARRRKRAEMSGQHAAITS